MLRIWILLWKLEQKPLHFAPSEQRVINNIKPIGHIWTLPLITEGAAGAQTFQNKTPAFAKPAKFKVSF